MIAIQR